MGIPFVIFGDAPGQTSGLSRILTDLAERIAHLPGLEVVTVGYAPYVGLPKQGVPTMGQVHGLVPRYRQWVFSDFSTRGYDALHSAWRYYFGQREGLVLSVWDPARCEGVATAQLPIRRWGYFAVDAETPTGKITGPAGALLQTYERLLGYTEFGAKILAASVGALGRPVVGHLPHGLEDAAFDPPTPDEDRWVNQQVPSTAKVIGCVATNQRRKDLTVWAQVLQQIPEAYGWLHTDRLVNESWSIPQILDDFGLQARATVTLTAATVPVRAIYDRCTVTIGPGRGEGFGYPLVESLAQGTPCVHTRYAGGGEVLPLQYTVPPKTYQYEGIYNLKRPVLAPKDFYDRVYPLYDDAPDPALVRTYAERFRWSTIWPAWQQWIEEGL